MGVLENKKSPIKNLNGNNLYKEFQYRISSCNSSFAKVKFKLKKSQLETLIVVQRGIYLFFRNLS